MAAWYRNKIICEMLRHFGTNTKNNHLTSEPPLKLVTSINRECSSLCQPFDDVPEELAIKACVELVRIGAVKQGELLAQYIVKPINKKKPMEMLIMLSEAADTIEHLSRNIEKIKRR